MCHNFALATPAVEIQQKPTVVSQQAGRVS